MYGFVFSLLSRLLGLGGKAFLKSPLLTTAGVVTTGTVADKYLNDGDLTTAAFNKTKDGLTGAMEGVTNELTERLPDWFKDSDSIFAKLGDYFTNNKLALSVGLGAAFLMGNNMLTKAALAVSIPLAISFVMGEQVKKDFQVAAAGDSQEATLDLDAERGHTLDYDKS